MLPFVRGRAKTQHQKGGNDCEKHHAPSGFTTSLGYGATSRSCCSQRARSEGPGGCFASFSISGHPQERSWFSKVCPRFVPLHCAGRSTRTSRPVTGSMFLVASDMEALVGAHRAGRKTSRVDVDHLSEAEKQNSPELFHLSESARKWDTIYATLLYAGLRRH